MNDVVITSRAHPFFKHLIQLGKSTRYRKKNGLTLLDGIHLVRAYHAALGSPVNFVISQSGYESKEIKHLLGTIKGRPVPSIVTLSNTLFHQASPVKTPTGILALIAIPKLKTASINKIKKAFWVMLECIQDPGNLGSILRSAAAAGVNDIYLSTGCADAWAPKTLRAAMGAHFLLRIHEQSDLIEVTRQFNGKVIATSLQARKSIYQTCLTGSVALIFGNEGMGLSNEVLQTASEQIMIPMPGATESLNAAAAAAVCLFERVRQCNNHQNDIIRGD